jgi:hypothetical protein
MMMRQAESSPFCCIPTNWSFQTHLDVDGISDLYREMARFRIKLEKKWGNGHDNTKVYIYPDGTKLPLTPHMLEEWAHALVCLHSITILGIRILIPF